MRTDAKIGFAIGGVLLAVLTVYAVVVPKHKKTNSTASIVVLPPASSDGGSTSTTTPPIAAADSGAMTPVQLPPATGIAAAAPSKEQSGAAPVASAAAAPLTIGSQMPETAGASTPVEGFHPMLTPKDLPRADDQKTGKLVDGVWTPADSTSRLSKPKHESSASPLPDDADVATTSDTFYTIKSGQTLSKIAYEVYGNSRFWVVIQRENRGLDANHLKVGSKIKLPDVSSVIPGAVTVSDEEFAPMAAATETPRHTSEIASSGRTYTVKSGDSLYGIAKRLFGSGRKADAIYTLNKEVIGADESKLKVGMVLKLPEATRPTPAN